MMVPARKDSFLEWVTRLRAGDDDAAREIFGRFTRQLIALAHRQFGAGLRHKVDPEDVVQSAYKSFLGRYGEGNLEAVTWNGLWGLLTRITVRKCLDRVAYHQAACRDVRREVAAATGVDEVPGLETLGREPTPLEAVLLNETVHQLLTGLDETERPIVELSLQGYTTQEISERLGHPERTVRRLRERVRKRLERAQSR
jgi:RNA polymerase sigma-70 factor (ECF subfamily)